MPPLILLAEDEPMLRELLTLELREQGFEVQAVADGRAAMQAYYERTPHLVLIDLLMPRLDGYGVLKELRLRRSAVPVVVLSNLGSPEDRQRCADLGATAYFVKNDMETDVLCQRIREWL